MELNEKEKRIIPIDEIHKLAKRHIQNGAVNTEQSGINHDNHVPQEKASGAKSSAEIANEISRVIQSFIRQPNQNRKSDLDRMLDEQKFKSEQAKRRRKRGPGL